MFFGTFFVNSRGDKGTEMPGLTNKNTVLGVLLFKTLQINIMELEGFIFRNNDDDDNEWEQHSWRRSSDPLAANTPWLPLPMMPDYHHLCVHMLPTHP